jgi:tRNA(Ile2) C34 agmatinyltransferase TiaS
MSEAKDFETLRRRKIGWINIGIIVHWELSEHHTATIHEFLAYRKQENRGSRRRVDSIQSSTWTKQMKSTFSNVDEEQKEVPLLKAEPSSVGIRRDACGCQRSFPPSLSR